MQYRPDAPTLLGAVADVLDDVLGEVPLAEQHRVRVAAHLARLVEREMRLGPAAGADESASLGDLLETRLDAPPDVAGGAALGVLVERVAMCLRELDLDDDDFDAHAWEVLVEVTRRDLDIAKPGHTQWSGR